MLFFLLFISSSKYLYAASDCNFGDMIDIFCQSTRIHIKIIKSSHHKWKKLPKSKCHEFVINAAGIEYDISLTTTGTGTEKCYLFNGNDSIARPNAPTILNVFYDSSCIDRNGTHAIGIIKVRIVRNTVDLN